MQAHQWLHSPGGYFACGCIDGQLFIIHDTHRFYLDGIDHVCNYPLSNPTSRSRNATLFTNPSTSKGGRGDDDDP